MSDALGRMLRHPLRQRLLFEYSRELTHPADVARRLGRPLNVVAYHTSALARGGLLELVRTETRRGGCARYYRSTCDRIIETEGWVALSPGLRRALVRGFLDALEDDTAAAVATGAFDADHAHISRWPVQLDAVAIAEVDALLRAALDDLAAIQARADRRSGERPHVYHVSMLGFHTGDAP
jgi:hypothetical protein